MKLTKLTVARVQYYETLHVIEDGKGERIFIGSEETAKRVLKLLKQQARKPKGKAKRK